MTNTPPHETAMYRTMHGQPEQLRRLLEHGWEPVEEAASRLGGVRRLFLVGIGTSYHAALAGEWMLRSIGVDARAVSSPDFADYADAYPLRQDDGVVILAHSGVKTASSHALARALAQGASVVSVGSLTAEHPGSPLVLRTVERETSAAYTASHTAAMFVLAQLATRLAGTTAPAQAPVYQRALEGVPDQVADVLRREAEIEPVARASARRLIYAAGAGPSAVSALEVVIKVREAARAHIDGLPLEQFLHGPLVVVNKEDFGVLVNPPGANPASTRRTGEIAGVLTRIGTPLWIAGEPVAQAPDATVFALPELPEPLSTIVSVVPMQILANQLATVLGADPDRFRREDPVYAEALGSLTL
ncbi:MAG: SIS domain-containing protein [Candidatus Dormibacteraceae bacterium]